ncbi:hypothetical protein M409DRAFT_53112 [Zasmidium cellare ATCC 36951]|uniref:Uncharacterized protein n=1 Tax=Zasmidium cellare ATCC 36951 TaxID=1080233 RepID=A0A6A6CRI0_ZASCE|nr:uncharacterized protein M409DRAFT_53112 [Zasmidium cellare ATCC 36951]KAF2168432.1 hypothetical protein M409DRAFT_53112 [Zasmidium cellare ATCC 36951]
MNHSIITSTTSSTTPSAEEATSSMHSQRTERRHITHLPSPLSRDEQPMPTKQLAALYRSKTVEAVQIRQSHINTEPTDRCFPALQYHTTERSTQFRLRDWPRAQGRMKEDGATCGFGFHIQLVMRALSDAVLTHDDASILAEARTSRACCSFQHGSKYPLTVPHTPSLTDAALRAVEIEATKSNIILKKCELLVPGKHHDLQIAAKCFEDTWTKLHPGMYMKKEELMKRLADGEFGTPPRSSTNTDSVPRSSYNAAIASSNSSSVRASNDVVDEQGGMCDRSTSNTSARGLKRLFKRNDSITE